MTGNTPEPGDSPQLALYKRFGAACLDVDVAAMRACVDPDRFFAMLPGHGRLSFDQLVMEFIRLRELAPNFGRTVRILQTIEQGDSLAVRYYMLFMVEGQDVNRPVEVTSMDMVTFAAGRIVAMHVVYDRFDTNMQAAGKTG